MSENREKSNRLDGRELLFCLRIKIEEIIPEIPEDFTFKREMVIALKGVGESSKYAAPELAGELWMKMVRRITVLLENADMDFVKRVRDILQSPISMN